MLTKQELDDKVVAKKISQLSQKDKDMIVFYFSNGYAPSSAFVDETCKKLIELHIATKVDSYVDKGMIYSSSKGYLKLNYFGLLVKKKLGENNGSLISQT